MNGLFITGTDTDTGKTLVTLVIMQALQQNGIAVSGMKPVAAGIEIASELGSVKSRDRAMSAARQVKTNADALAIQQQSSVTPEYSTVNPYLFDPPIAPHIAAQQADVKITSQPILQAYQQLRENVDCVVVEGAGGWLVPLNDDPSDHQLDIADLPVLLGLPVVLVVGLKLGCINHARLSYEAIRQKGCRFAGWISSQVDAGMTNVDANIDALAHYLGPCLGNIPFLEIDRNNILENAVQSVRYIDTDALYKVITDDEK